MLPTLSSNNHVAPRRSETVLLVEDNPALLKLTRRNLERHGFRVLSAVDGKSGMRMIDQYADEIDLLLTDVVMPHFNGRELVDHFRTLNPKVKVLFMSGYTEDAILIKGIAVGQETLLHKPFTPEMLIDTVRRRLKERPVGVSISSR